MPLTLSHPAHSLIGCLAGTFAAVTLTLPAEAAQIVRWKFGSEEAPLLEFVTDTPIQPQAQFVFDPPRIVVDLPGVQFNRPTVNEIGEGAVRQIRIGQFDANTTRIVVELDSLQSVDPNNFRVRGLSQTTWVIEALDEVSPYIAQEEPTSEAAAEIENLSDWMEDSTDLEAQSSEEPSNSAESIKVTLPPYPFPQEVAAPAASCANRSLLVVVDAGHGGPDPGAIGRNDLRETEITLDIAQQVSRELEAIGITTKMTRTEEYDLDLAPRVNMAEQLNADLFVSIHANSLNLNRPDVNGVETYYYNSGLGLAEDIHQNILKAVQIRDRGVRKARFYVLTRTSMPAVLVETGFVTGAEDSVKLRNPLFRTKMAEAIAQGVTENLNCGIRN